MKSIIKKAFLVTLPVLFVLSAAVAQPPPPPEYGQDGDQHPAPIGSGLTILLALGAAYGAKKTYDIRRQNN